MNRNIKIVIGAIVVVAVVVFGGKYLRDNFSVTLPNYPPIKKVV